MNQRMVFGLSVFVSFFVFFLAPVCGQTSPGDEEFFSGSVKPNVLIILDNSNSMDEDFFGNAAGSWSTGSKAVEGKRVLNDLVTTYANTMRLGLMAYRLPSATKGFIYNNPYFVSYDPRSYCPTPVDACVEYCRTGSFSARVACQSACIAENPYFVAEYIDDSITEFAYGSASRNKYCGLVYPKTNRIPNPTDPSGYIYFKQALPYYDNDSTLISDSFLFSLDYGANDYYDDAFLVYGVKTGTSDGPPPYPPAEGAGYSSLMSAKTLYPTDSDIALGYNEFGRRVALLYVGKTWYATTSPGDGYLHVPVDDNRSDNHQLEALLANLETHEGRPDDYMSCTNTTNPNRCSYLVSAGLTPTPGTFQSVITYFQGNYPREEGGGRYPTPIQSRAAACQRNFIVYVTDGLPSVNESGATGTADSLMPSVIGKIQTLRSVGVNVGGNIRTYDIRTYVVGVGLTAEAKAKVDAMAQAGGTAVDGRAYYADNPEQLQEALDAIFTNIQSGTYSFSQPSVSAVRTSEENFIYAASFEPIGSEPFWKGFLKKIAIDYDGNLGSTIWEAGSVLEGTAEGGRNIKTLLGGYPVNFTTELSPIYFGLPWSNTEERSRIVGFVRGKSTLPYRGGEVANPDYPRKLGDIFHSNPVKIGAPSIFFNDTLSPGAFQSFREGQKYRDGLVLVGANDGQIHAFQASDGYEKWSIIPPNLLPKLQDWVHASHPTTKKHKYFVDGPISAADVWLGTGDGTGKLATDWKTLAVVGLGMGVRGLGDKPDYLWSMSPYCDGPFNDKYNFLFRNYCGYYALDVTNTAYFPIFKWVLDPGSTEAPYLGEPWSKMVMGKVRVNGQEKWVGFIGGGYTMGTPPGGKAGKGFFVVDLRTGDVLWSYTNRDNEAMGFIPGTPAIVDRDNDGFIDTAYVGDLSGNLWKFTFCPSDPAGAGCGLSNWRAMILYNPGGTKLPTFNSPAVAKDQNYYWVFWGTGDKANPNKEEDTQNKFLAIRDQNPISAYTLSNLQNITSTTFTEMTRNGWYINLSGQERVLSDATVFRGIVFFTSYTPPSSEDVCGAPGSAALYGMAMMPISIGEGTYSPGMGVFSEAGQRRIELGAGIPSAPVISLKPVEVRGGAPDVYVTVSGGGGSPAEIKSSSDPDKSVLRDAMAGSGPTTSIIHWRDLRVQP
jgi:type IV pilus assembly protein PilY1